MRLFLAFALPEAVKAVLVELQARGRRAGLRAAWPAPEAMHLTLAFLGEQPPEVLPVLREAAVRSAAEAVPMRLRTGPLGGFPTAQGARVAWLGLEPHPGLRALAMDLARRLGPLGALPDPRPFVPHLTFARLRHPADLAVLGEAPPSTPFQVEALDLIESHLEARGVRHRVVARFPLG